MGLTESNKSLFPAMEYGRYGFINVQGDFVIPPSFDEVHRFSEGLAAIRVDSLWGYIDSTGQTIIAPQFYEADDFSSGLASVDLINLSYDQAFIDQKGNIVFKPDEYTSSFSEGFAQTEVNNHVAYYNVNGEIQIQTSFPYGDSFSEGIVNVWTGDSSQYLDKQGRTIISLNGMGHGSFSEGLAHARINGRNAYINKNGDTVIDSLDMVGVLFDFSNGMAQVTIAGPNHKSGFINREGKVVIPVKYHLINHFSEDLASFKEGEKWGFLDKNGGVAIPATYDAVVYEGFLGGLCWVKKDNKWGYIDKYGEFVWTQDDDYMYNSIDTTKWRLDTLEINHYLFSERTVRTNRAHPFPSDSVSSLQLHVNPREITPFANKYLGHKIYLINGSSDSLQIPAQDGRLKMLQQAQTLDGEWEYVENFIDSWCGNSYHDIILPSNQYFVFSSPMFKGDFETKIRYELELNDDKKIYSNEYVGIISKNQFLTVKLGDFE